MTNTTDTATRCHGHDLPGQSIVAHVCSGLCTVNACCLPARLPASGSQITVTYDPRTADPSETDGGYVWVGTVTDVTPDGFDFVPANGKPGWSIMASEIDRGVCQIDPKLVG